MAVQCVLDSVFMSVCSRSIPWFAFDITSQSGDHINDSELPVVLVLVRLLIVREQLLPER